MGQTDYHQVATVPPGKHDPFCDRSNLRLAVTQELALAIVFSSLLTNNRWWWLKLSSWQQRGEAARPLERFRACGTIWILFNITLMACSQREWQRMILCCFQSTSLISIVGRSFIQKECAKLGSAVITAHLWALWTEIVHFPSESSSRPIIRIILGTPEYPVVTASSESISQSHRSCPEPKQLHHSVT